MPLLLLNKPFRVLSQFRDDTGKATLADFVSTPDVYPAGRLDFDSEGLLLLTDDGKLQAAISQPRSKLPKRYWVQVEGEITSDQLSMLRDGVLLKDGPARALVAERMDEPAGLWARDPPIRQRQTVPDTWLDLSIDEGRNRQVRRMTAKAGLPTLRLIRCEIGPFHLADLEPGQVREMPNSSAWKAIQKARQS